MAFSPSETDDYFSEAPTLGLASNWTGSFVAHTIVSRFNSTPRHPPSPAAQDQSEIHAVGPRTTHLAPCSMKGTVRYRARTRARKQTAAVLQRGLCWRSEETLIDRLRVGGQGHVLVLRSGRGCFEDGGRKHARPCNTPVGCVGGGVFQLDVQAGEPPPILVLQSHTSCLLRLPSERRQQAVQDPRLGLVQQRAGRNSCRNTARPVATVKRPLTQVGPTIGLDELLQPSR